MTNSPKRCDETKFQKIYRETNCASRLEDCIIEVHENEPYTTKQGIVVKHRFETRKSKDSTCTVMVDIYSRDGEPEEEFIYTLEVDGKEYWPHYDQPRPAWA